MSSAQALLDQFLFRKLFGVARGERKFIRLGRHDSRAAVRPAQSTPRFHHRKIAANRRNGRFHVLGQFFQRREFNALKILFNAMFALFCGHGSKARDKYTILTAFGVRFALLW